MRRAALAALVAFVLALAYLSLWPIDAQPAAWKPLPPPAPAGPLAPNDALAAVQRLEVDGRGPEDVAIGPDGRLYAGLEDGRIVRLPAGGGAVETFARTGGRPLGLRFGPDGWLFVADARRGLLAVAADGAVAVLSTSQGGRPYGLTDDLDVARDGTVYFTDATDTHPLGHDVQDIVEHQPRGRLLAYTRADGATRLVKDGLFFANGVALAADDSYVLVVETASYRVLKCALAGAGRGRCDVFADNLPGFPDGIARGERGVFWVTLAAPRNGLLDRLHPHPALKKALLRLPGFLRPGPRAHGYVLGLDADGRIVHNLQDPSGRAFALATNAIEHEGLLYLGSLTLPYAGRIRAPR
jgi:sugar lactone lactonase YvrE